MGDAGLCALGDEVEDGGAGGFGASTCGGGDGDEGFEGAGYGEATAEGGVDKVEEVGVWGWLEGRLRGRYVERKEQKRTGKCRV